ncbi:phage tail protein [Pseudomonas citronellolis]|uniref:Phage tail protein n=1 Tax=Pseudomonas citronellolis TaxID=53408 RepID=A0AAW6P3U2_9PSED|nr:phage tail protein [Pseudomonas citronellolis]MDF3841113.1 phage tail protein [Pseudomonas citronellolis]
MSSGSKKQTVGYWYRILGHYGLSKGPVDAFLELRGGDRTAWKGLLSASGRIRVAAANLWGGQKSEGGLDGDMDLMFGEADQAPNDYLEANLGEQPAYRGKFTAVWRGGRYGAMNPYPKTLSFKLRRILKGWDDDAPWYPEKAAIPLVPAEPMALYFSLDISGSMATVTPNGKTRLENMKSAVVAALQIISDVVLSTDTEVDVIVVGWGTEPSTRTNMTRRRCTKGDIVTLQYFVNGLASGLWTYFPAGLVDMPEFFGGAPEGAKKMVFFCTDGEPSTSDGSMTADQIAATAGNLVKAQAGVSVYAMNIDLDNTQYTAQVDNTPEDGVPVIAGDNPDAITNVIISGLGGLIGMNAIHILYDSLVARDMQAEPAGLINEASFRAAADKVYAEGLGLCTEYVPDEEDIEAFQQRICDVIGANLTQSRVDGQYYVDLIRGDYDLASLPILTSDDVMEFSQEPTNLNEVVNQITVKWFDPQNKEERTTQPIQSMGAIMAAGSVIAETKTYRELPTEGLALRVGARDLQAKATPLSRFDLTTNRRPWKWRPGNYFRLQLPEEGIADMVCVLGDIDTGTHIDGRCRLKAIQDVFAFPDTVYVQPEPGLAEPENPNPTAAPHQVLLEAPYIELLTSLSNADMAAFPVDAGALLTIATRPSNGLNYSIYSAAEGESLADNGTADWCPSAAVTEEAGFLDTEFTLTNGNDLHNVEEGSWALWGSEIVRVDALDVTAGTVTLGRGCADTPPTKHIAGERLYFCGDWVGTDGREYVDGETVSAKLLTRTSSNEQTLASAQLLTIEMAQRQYRPYPPAGLKVNGASYPAEIHGSVNLTWVPRDRFLQADKLIDTTAAGVGPEPGTTWSVRCYIGTTLDHSDDGLTDNSLSWTPSYAAGVARVEVRAIRDGVESLYPLAHEFNLGAELWTPAQLAVAPTIWLDDQSDVTVSGGLVTQWNDRSGNAWHFSQSTAGRQPALLANELNGQRVIRFDGADDNLATSVTGARDLFRNTSKGWVLSVLRRRGAGNAISVVFGVPRGSTAGVRFGSYDNLNGASQPAIGGRRLDADTFSSFTSTKTKQDSWYLRLDTVDWSAQVAALWLDGALDGQATGLWSSGSTTDTASGGPLSVGAVYSASGFTAEGFSNSDIAAVLVGSGSIPGATDIDRLFGWAAWHFGLADLLPAGHPYKDAPPSVPADVNQIIFPLTYDEVSKEGLVSWDRQGNAPHVTPKGFEGDGYEARYKSTGLPGWMVISGMPLTLHATVQVNQPRSLSSRDSVVFIGANTAAAAPTLELAVVADPFTAAKCMLAVRATTSSAQQMVLGRPSWRYQFRFPELAVGANQVRPQALLFLDSDTLVITGHFADTECRAYKVRLSDKVVLAQFTFGTTTNRHVSALAKRANGDVWAADYDSGKLLQLDLEASFSSGTAVILASYDTSVLVKVSGVNFVTVSGTEYALVSEYATSGTPYLYVIPASLLGAGTFAITNRYKRFNIGLRVQGHDMSGGKLWVSRNVPQGGSSAYGAFQRYNILTAISSSGDGATLTAEVEYEAPSSMPEDVAFHPTTGEAWTGTEGASSGGDLEGFLGLWSSPLDGKALANHYTLEYDGSAQVTIKINNQVFAVAGWALGQVPQAVSIGGLPLASKGFLQGYSFAYVRNLVIQNAPMDQAGYDAAVSGSYEPNTLTAYQLTLTNPGAELNSTSGWANEIGGLAVRSANPPAYEGSYYFSGGSVVQTVARQRLDLVAQGLSAGDLDTGALWAKVRWAQSSWNSAEDPGGMGIRLLNGANTQLAVGYSGLAYTPNSGAGGTGPWYWWPRSWPISVQANTRYLDALFNASGRTAGTNNDHYVDSIEVVIYKP